MPTLRNLTNKDLLAYQQLCAICYGDTFSEPPRSLEEAELHQRVGVFAEDGRLLSAMIQQPLQVRFCGETVKMLAVGGVVTDPVARRGGGVRHLFEEGLPRLYAEGNIFSALYPFSFAFYEKFGYTWADFSRIQVIRPENIRADLRPAKEICRVLPDEPAQGMMAVYDSFIRDKHLAVLRDESMWNALRRGTPWGNQRHAYVMKESGETIAYWIGTMRRDETGTTLRIEDMAWKRPRGREAIFAMLRSMNEVNRVEVRSQSGFDLLTVAVEAYAVAEKERGCGMVRVMNVVRALALLPAPVLPGRLTIAVTDGQIPQNNGLFTVEGDGYALSVTPASRERADVQCDIRGLSALVLGRCAFRDALDEGLAEMYTDAKMRFAELLFPRRTLHLNRQF